MDEGMHCILITKLLLDKKTEAPRQIKKYNLSKWFKEFENDDSKATN